MDSHTTAERIVGDFVRGLRTWRDLEQVGLTVSFMDDGCDCEGRGLAVVAVSAKDIAEGIERMHAGSAVEFRRWASVLLAASAVIDLAEVESHVRGETLLNALWDASAGEELSPETISVVGEVSTNRGVR